MLEKAPTLVFDTNLGVFRHAYSLSGPSPPPPPSPPPRLISYGRPSPRPPPPPPAPPPPWFADIEQCVPVITPAEAGLDPNEQPIDEERALCVYVRSLSDERVEARRCFSGLSPFPPPPPPTPQSTLAAIEQALRRKRRRRQQRGASDVASQPAKTEEEEFASEHAKRAEETRALLDRLSQQNWKLRDVLADIRKKFDPTEGRRLFERLAGVGKHALADNVLRTDLAVGGGALFGLTNAECATVCAALANETDPSHACNGIAYRVLDPADPSNLELAFCYVLKSVGSCTPVDFAASIFNRRDTSGCRAPTAQDNPMCVQMAPGRQDMQVLDYAAARASCRHGKGSPRMPRPRSTLESFSFIGYSRERGVHAFFAEKPQPRPVRQRTHWSGVDSQPFYVEPGDERCILVATESENPHGRMFARMVPCARPHADGVVCESGAAAP